MLIRTPWLVGSLLLSQSRRLVVNASGTGKTRLLFEVLARRWGFFFACAQDGVTNPYGSADLTDAMDAIYEADSLTYELMISRPRAHDFKRELEMNRRIARRYFNRVLLARLLIFDRFCTAFLAAGTPIDVACRRWLLLQLRPETLLGNDIFLDLSQDLRRMSDSQVMTELGTLLDSLVIKPQFIAIDEAQVASLLCDTAFASDNGKRHAPLLRELVVCASSR